MIEQEIIDNVANKLELILFTKKISVLALSKILGVDKQALYRVIRREHLPNITLLGMIAQYLNCTVVELIDNRFFLDIKIYKKYNDNADEKYKIFRIFFYEEDIKHILKKDLFGVVVDNHINVLYNTDKINSDGYYLIQDYKTNVKKIEIISAGKNLIIALDDKKNEIRLDPKDINVVSKFYKKVLIQQTKEYACEINFLDEVTI